MTADRLLRLYPRAWRERYGGEFLDTAGPDALTVQQVIDITMGAIDAWLSADVRRSAGLPAATTTQGGHAMLTSSKALCANARFRMTTKDGLVSAAVLLATTFAMLIVGIWVNRLGYHETGEVLKALAFPVSVTFSMPFGVMKGQPWRAQVVVLGGTLVFLILIGVLSTRI